MSQKQSTSDLMYWIYVGVFGVMFIFVFFNMGAWMMQPALYFSFIQGGRKEAIAMVRSLRGTQYYSQELERQKKLHQDFFAYEIGTDLDERSRVIAQMEGVLQQNPEARDVLHSLSVLYANNGDMKTSQEYLSRAKAVDPQL